MVFALGANAQVYCSAGPTSTFDSEITGVLLNGNTLSIDNFDSACGTAGVQDFTSMFLADLTTDSTYTIEIDMGMCGATSYAGALAAWIDFNADGDFTDAGELLGTYSGLPPSTQTFSFTVPSNAVLGSTRLRVMQEEGGSTATISACGTFTWGAVEDYQVYIDSVVYTCIPPDSVNITNVGLDSALVNFTSSGIQTYVEYGLSPFTPSNSQSAGTAISTAASSVWLTGLDTFQSYDVFVYDMCADSSLSFPVGPITFTTPQCSPSDLCQYEIELIDSFGDGWNGAEVKLVTASGVTLQTLGASFTTGSSYVETVGLCNNESFYIEVLNEGSYPEEIGLNVTSYGASFGSYSPTLTTAVGTIMLQFNSSCNPSCLPPSMGAINPADSSISLNWNSTGSVFTIEYGLSGFTQGTGTTVQVLDTTALISGLNPGVRYDFYLQNDCTQDSNGLSVMVGPFTVQTLSCPISDLCPYDFELTSSWFSGGWGNNRIEIVNSSGVVEYTLGENFLQGSSFTETVMLCIGQSYTVEVSQTDFLSSYIGLNIVKGGNVQTSYAPSTSTALGTQMAQFTANCNTSCPTPTSLAYIAGKNESNFTFDQNGGSATYLYQWGPVGFAQSTGTISGSLDSTTSNSFLITGLSAASCYDVFVVAHCGSAGFSDTLGPLTFCTNLCDTTDLCTWTMSMYDSFGDGWNGAEVQVLYNGVFGQSFTLPSGNSSITEFKVCSGTQITVVNSAAGSYPAEVSYVMSNAAGTQSTSVSATAFALGIQDTLFSNCVVVSCPTPSNLTNTNIGASTADISWTGGTGTFSYEYRAQGTTVGQMMGGTTTSTTASLTGLTSATTYDFFVKEVCGPGDTSMTMYHTFTTDSCTAISLGNPQFNVDSVTATAAALSFNWTGANTTGFNISFGDGNSTTGTGGSVSHVYTANGTYSVTLTVYNDCDTATKTFSVQVGSIGVEENLGISALMIYPNPTSGLITINGELNTSSTVDIRILNFLGQEIIADQFNPASSALSKTYDLSAASAGAYLIEVSTDQGVVRKSILVRH